MKTQKVIEKETDLGHYECVYQWHETGLEIRTKNEGELNRFLSEDKEINWISLLKTQNREY